MDSGSCGVTVWTKQNGAGDSPCSALTAPRLFHLSHPTPTPGQNAFAPETEEMVGRERMAQNSFRKHKLRVQLLFGPRKVPACPYVFMQAKNNRKSKTENMCRMIDEQDRFFLPDKITAHEYTPALAKSPNSDTGSVVSRYQGAEVNSELVAGCVFTMRLLLEGTRIGCEGRTVCFDVRLTQGRDGTNS